MKIHMLVFQLLVTGVVTIILCGVSYAKDACDVIGQYSNINIEQSELSEKIFGIERETEELRYLIEIDNIIENDHFKFNDYIRLVDCIDSYDSRFIKRNAKFFKLLLISVLTGDTPEDEKNKIIKYVIEALQSKDKLVIGQAVYATVPFNDKIFIPYLKHIVFSAKNDKGLQKTAIDMLAFISGSQTRDALVDIKQDLSDPEITELINTRLKESDYLYH